MAVLQMNILACALTCALAFAGIATSAAQEVSYSDCSSTLPIVTQDAGSTTSDGTVLSTWSMCTIVHETHCEDFTSTGGNTPLPTVTGSGSVPGQGPPSSYGGDEGKSSTYHGQNEGSQSVTAVSTAASGSQPGYSVPATDVPGQGSIPPGETPTIITGVSSSVSVHTEATGYQTGSDSYSPSETNPTGTETEAYTSGPSDATGTPPSTTVTGAASMHNAVPAALLGVAGMIVAIVF